jgi:hypothetical protein
MKLKIRKNVKATSYVGLDMAQDGMETTVIWKVLPDGTRKVIRITKESRPR